MTSEIDVNSMLMCFYIQKTEFYLYVLFVITLWSVMC